MKIKRFILLLTVILLLLSSCGPPQVDSVETDGSSNTGSVDTGAIYLMKDGESVFDLVYPSNSKFPNISIWVDQIKSSLNSNADIDIATYDDKATAKSEFLILLGDTKYQESQLEAEQLGKGGFSVCKKGNYIIINASDDISMVKAVNWFCNTLLKKAQTTADGKNVTLDFEENRNIGTVAEREIKINGISLEKYTVIYPKGKDVCKAAAEALVSVCNTVLGVPLRISDDSLSSSNYEILVGKTNRGESATVSNNNTLAPMEYKYEVINGKMSIIAYADHGYGLMGACEEFVDNLLYDKKVNLEDGFMKNCEIKLKTDKFATLAEDADARVMTANLLSEEWGGTECLPRAEVFYANLMYYKPDVIGAQEVSIKWTSALKTVLENSSYAVLHEVVTGTDSNYCPMIYNTDTLELIESGAYRLSIGGPAKARTVTWGVFKHKVTQKTFIVLNTHLDWIADVNDYETTAATSHYSREMQVRELAGTFVELREKYPDVDILMTADWNTAKNKHPLDILCELTEAVFAEDMMPDNDWREYEVDHILMTADTDIKAVHCYYENGRDLGATDHPWGFVDIKLK
ncbi:MAG: hypothetical protein IJ011_01710 [Clostridia bacterium]|nr:hypothetical protein [Clostridia bacterium]